MKFSKQLCLFVASLGLASAFNAIDISSTNKPHNIKINKRDSPADIIVGDSDTLPVEDSGSALSSVPAKPHSQVVKTAGDSSKVAKPTSKTSQLTTDELHSTKTKSNEKAVVVDEEDSVSGSNSPFLMSISMIIISEIGDKTFLIAALMAMRNSRALVFSAAFSSLAIMTILSGVVGHALPTLISQRVTQFLAAGLFVVFGIKLTKEGLAMSKDLGVDEELAEVEEELTVSDINHDLDEVEAGGRAGVHKKTQFQQIHKKFIYYSNLIASHVFSPLWIQVFVMTFLGEWGDRSQIATIAMAAGSEYWPVIWGAVIGHGLCTGAAVVGGKMLATRISMRTVTLAGAFAFFVFSILYFYEALNGASEA